MPVYEGLSNKARAWILLGAALIVIANLGLVWYETDKALNQLPISSEDINVIKSVSDGPLHSTIQSNNQKLRVHAINITLIMKGIINKQSIIIVCIGSAFSFIAIGFALFLIGADGAFKLNATHGEAKVVMSATAPGLACFLFAAILISIAATREFKLEPGHITMLEQEAPQINVISSDDKNDNPYDLPKP
ncbi:hypothetical protein GCM10007978_36280 [Shewanella hanedai]|uniref:Uncharacterized protein n=1 Tax=Shewanella hanedai TaxID=25 RepID=A0A553JJF2_SHEHA|nr:hypothetical protein [Shewanella hanedai]TRY12565.1 hypothetical protein FN961_20180 [Shewanella hanedai]GGI95342.1 hypothetical protein GCM10007978_36280 [Shewanella hanedai]